MKINKELEYLQYKAGEFVFIVLVMFLLPIYLLNILPVEEIEILCGVRHRGWSEKQ